MYKYLLGFLINLFNFKVSKFSLIDNKSKISKQAKVNRACQVYNSKIESYSYVGPNSKLITVDI